MRCRMVALALLAVAMAAPASAQDPFLGSVPHGAVSAEPLPLSAKDAVTRALEYNLGLLLQQQALQSARGARWRALEDLLPNVKGSVGESRQIIDLAAYGFKADPSVVGPFNVFDARLFVSQPVIDLSALHHARAAAATERAESKSIQFARDLVILVTVNLYLQTIAAASRVEAAHAQQATADALYRQATDLKSAGVVAGIDVLRAQGRIQTERQRAIEAENDLEKSKLRLARAIGLPVGQPIRLTDTIPYAAADTITIESAMTVALASRADYHAAKERLLAAEAEQRAAVGTALPSLHVDADYGTIGPTTSELHQTFRVAATVKVPIFDAGKSKARRIEADAEIKRRQAELDDLQGRVELEVRTAVLDLRAAGQQVEAARTNATLAAQELEQARDRFAAGISGSLEVTEAQSAVAAASDAYINALYAHNLAKASLVRAEGTAEQTVMTLLGGGK